MDREAEAKEELKNQHSSDPEHESSQDSSCNQPLVVVNEEDTMNNTTESDTSTLVVKHLHRWYHINWEMLPSKLAYFLNDARRMCYTPFLIIFYTSLGLSKVEAGIILGFRMMGTVFGGPIWGIISDKWHCHRTVLIVMTMLSIITMCCKPIISIQYGAVGANKCRITTTTTLLSTNTSSFRMENISATAMSLANETMPFKAAQTETPERFGTLFFAMFFTSMTLAFCEGSSVALVDTVTIRKVQLSRHRKIKFGAQRMWGPPGGIIGNILTNLAMQYFPGGNMSCFTPMFVIFSALSIFWLITLLILYSNVSFKSDSEEDLFMENQLETDEQNNEKIPSKNEKLNEKPIPFREILRKSVLRLDTIVLFFVTFVFGMMQSPMFNFHYLYLKELSAPQFAYSVITAAGAISGIIGFRFNQNIVNRIGSWNTIGCASALYVLVLAVFGTANSHWYLIASRPAFGFAFCVFIPAGICHVKEISPVATMTTMISIFNTIYLGCGPMAGLIVSGEIYEAYNGSVLYTTFAVIAVVLTCFIAVYSFYYSRYLNKSEKSDSKC